MSQDGMIEKLKVEIHQLEQWLDSQQREGGDRSSGRGTVSLVPTIQTLISTRRRLLQSLEQTR